jgi:PPP family 3-phenylpropionic acid transporter
VSPRLRLIVFYVLYFMSVGLTLPFGPAYLKGLGLTASQVGLLLAISPLLFMLMPPLWGAWADRSGKPGRVLTVAAAGAAVGELLLAFVGGFPGAFGALLLHGCFVTGITTLADSLALGVVARSGGSYASVRAWGSFGFMVASFTAGQWVEVVDRRLVLSAAGLMFAFALWAGLALRQASREAAPAQVVAPPRARLRDVLRTPGLGWLLVASATHWVACTPWHGSLAIYFGALGLSPRVVGLTASLAVASEVLVLSVWARWLGRVPLRAALFASFAVSGLRWGGMAVTSSAEVMAGLALLHGLTFGAFYVASVEWIASRVPQNLRASGQALFAAATFGVGGSLGYMGGGFLYDAWGGRWLFGVAGALELVPLVCLLLLRPNTGVDASSAPAGRHSKEMS